jgi:flavin-dependent dehydrogenase
VTVPGGGAPARLASTEAADVLVVGAGLAGLHTATLLARSGHEVLLVERRPGLAGAIRTTGIFVRKTLDDFPLPPGCLGPPIRRVVLYPPDLRRPVTLVSGRDEFRVGDMAPLYLAAARAAVEAGVRLVLGTRYTGRRDGAFLVSGPDGPTRVRACFLVGADGARSRVARDLALDRNVSLLAGAEEVFAVPPGGAPPTFHCVLDPSLAPGYLAWVVNDGRHAHVGVAGYADRFPGGLRRALDRFGASAPGLPGVARPDGVERRGGPIPVGGLLRRIGCADGLLVGDAAGAVSPLTAGGLDPCLRLSERAAAVLDDALRTGRPDAVRHYDGAALRASFRGRLLLRRGLAQVRTPTAAAMAFSLLRTPAGKAAARRILFGDRSFPGPGPG